MFHKKIKIKIKKQKRTKYNNKKNLDGCCHWCHQPTAAKSLGVTGGGAAFQSCRWILKDAPHHKQQ